MAPLPTSAATLGITRTTGVSGKAASRSASERPPSTETTAGGRPISPATASRPRGLVGEDHDVRALGELAIARHGLASGRLGERRGPLGHGIGAEHRLAQPERQRPSHVPRTYESDGHRAKRLLTTGGQDWLKKPFSIKRARSSAETSTLRGVSRNTLSAIRCIPPSSA